MVWPLVLALIISGCTSTSERSLSLGKRTQITERKPTPDGGYVEKVTEYTEGERSSEIATKADADWGVLASNGVGAAVTGDWGALAGVLGTAGAAGIAGWLQHRRARELKADSDEGWAKYEAAMKDKSDA